MARPLSICASFIMLLMMFVSASAQEGLGPFMPNDGGQIATAWGNAFGPDAESWITFTNVQGSTFDISYSSSRGTKALRRIQIADRNTARILVLGYNAKMPLLIPQTTTLGTSGAVLEELRTTGHSRASLIYDANLNMIGGEFTMVDGSATFSVPLGGKPIDVPAVVAKGQFAGKGKRAEGTFTFLSNENNPLLLEYSVSFTGEKTPRTERVVGVTPGAALRGAMEQALATVGKFRTYGIHFDFDKATIRSDSSPLIDDMALTMKNNALWTIQITGHTDAIGKASYNAKLSQARADALKADLVKRGVQPERLLTAGAGATQSIGSNKTLEGRALNRRVEIVRTDR